MAIARTLTLTATLSNADSKDAKAFAEIFHLTDPDVFLDNHVSDERRLPACDDSYLLHSTANLGGVIGRIFEQNVWAWHYMQVNEEKGYDLVPYVNAFGDTPDSGWPEFWNSPAIAVAMQLSGIRFALYVWNTYAETLWSKSKINLWIDESVYWFYCKE